MKLLVRGAVSLTFVMFVVSCSGLLKKKKGDEDAGLDATVAAADEDAAPAPDENPSPTPAPALASNEGDIARFPDETKLDSVPATLLRSYNVREAPPAGEVVASLGKGTTVSQIGQRGTAFLILFDDPKNPGNKLMGWIHRDAFSTVIQDAGPLVCPKGEIALWSDTPFCGKLCSADTDCGAGQACKGQANKLLANGKAGDGVTVCTAYHPHDAGGPPVVVDAGKSPTLDAGKLPTLDAGGLLTFDAGKLPTLDAGLIPKVIDAGPAPTPAGPASDVVPATGGKCPANFVLVAKTGKCHRPCPGGPTKGECKNVKAFCIKCDKDQKKVCAESQDQCR
ncbi:MAG TPA: hypothetical protein VM580_11810 [Labilithrix sp.]|jgi:hypothetical protein|nr:hypothetical protein [Labilithrix sp.]